MSLPIFSVFFRFLPFFFPFSSPFFPFPFFSRLAVFSGSDFLPFSSVLFRFLFRKRRGDTGRETPFAKPRFIFGASHDGVLHIEQYRARTRGPSEILGEIFQSVT